MEMARNPAAMRELMRSQDRQLSNIEVQLSLKGAEQIPITPNYMYTYLKINTQNSEGDCAPPPPPPLLPPSPIPHTHTHTCICMSLAEYSRWLQCPGEDVHGDPGAHDGCSTGISECFSLC